MDTELVTKHNLPGLVADKIDKSEVNTLIPDQVALEARVKMFASEMDHDLEDRMTTMLQKLDLRLVGLRRDVDID